MASTGKLALLTSGGDAPGMNAAIRAATLLAHDAGLEVLGVRLGYYGLVRGDFVRLQPEDVAGIQREGGTVLGSARLPAFAERAMRDTARRRLAEAGVEHVLVIGGNGSLTGARALGDPEELEGRRLGVVGVPASIDNDVGLTGLSIGVDTAVNTIVDACDKIADTASAHGRTFFVEVMGRDCGYLAMQSGIAAGADLVLFPESGRDEGAVVDAVVSTIVAARGRPRPPKRVLVIKAEGVPVTVDRLKALVDARLAASLKPSPAAAEATLPDTPLLLETRVSVLGHIVRGGRPSAADRVMAGRLGFAAVKALLAGETRVMAAWAQAAAPPPGARTSPGDPHCWLVELDAVLAETRRLLDGTSPTVRWRTRIFEEVEALMRR
jgi:6-phosphofructokinase 1